MDTVTRAIIWNSFVAIAEESAAVIERTAYSQVVREAGDFSTAIFDSRGRMLGQGAHSVGHLGSMNFALRRVVESVQSESLHDGDVVCFNDPEMGAGHLPDIYVVTPVFHEGGRVGFAVNVAHHVDVGGIQPGSMGIVGTKELAQEGLFIPPCKIYRDGEPVEDLFELIACNSRTPEAIRGDLEAQIGGVFSARDRYLQLHRTFGADAVAQAGEELFDWTEEQMRIGISSIPDGRYTATDYMDGHGPGTTPISLVVTVEINDSDAHVDFDGTSDQVPAGMNSYPNFTFSYAYFAVKCIASPDAPQNDGSLRAVSVSAPLGSVLNPRPGAPCGGRAVLNFRLYEVVLQALSWAVPERVVAPGPQAFNLTFAGTGTDTDPGFVCYELLLGNFGGRSGSDGPDGLTSIVNAANVSVEVNEQRYPIRVDQVSFMADKFGAGQYRSALPIRRDYAILRDGVTFTNGSDRHISTPPGLQGGQRGGRAETLLYRSGTSEPEFLDSKGTYVLNAGDVLSIQPAGGGGYGPPRERSLVSIERDLRQGFMSEAYCRQWFPHALEVER